MAIPITEKIKYLGVYINSKTNSTDPAMALRIFLEVLIISCLFLALQEMKCWQQWLK